MKTINYFLSRSWQNDTFHNSTWNGNSIANEDSANVTCEMNVLKARNSWELQPVLQFLNPDFNSLWDLEWIKIFMIIACIFVVTGLIREIYQLLRYEIMT